MLPHIDGFEVLKRLKSDSKTKDIKIVVHTNLDSETQKEKALNMGADRFLAKTGNNPQYLVDAVKELISP
jgi:CheY-like chemotaxis protein